MKRVFILDRSGSMISCVDDTIGGYNAFVEDQKSLGGHMSLYLFDHEIVEVYKDKPIEEVEPLTRADYVPRGSTALFDTIGHVVTNSNITDTTSVVILTDGAENASSKYSGAAVKDLVNMFTAKGTTFLYLGANQDAFSEADKLGILERNAMRFDTEDTTWAFENASQCVRIRSSGDDATPLTPSPFEY